MDTVSWLDRTRRSKISLYLCGRSLFLYVLPPVGKCENNIVWAWNSPKAVWIWKTAIFMNYLCQSGKYLKNHILMWSIEGSDQGRWYHWPYEERESLCWLTTNKPDSCVTVGLLSWQQAAHTMLDWSFLPQLWGGGNLISSCMFLLFQGEVMVVVQCFISPLQSFCISSWTYLHIWTHSLLLSFYILPERYPYQNYFGHA